jgi:hypothetical protein
MKVLGNSITAGVVFILTYIVIEQIDARYFRPRIRELSLNSSVECHDDPKKCWLIEHKQRAYQK